MKTLNKAVIAAAVAAALTPVASQADTTIFGQIDIAVGIESAEETAIAVEGSPLAGDNILGIEGNFETSNGNAITYQYVINIDADGDSSSGVNVDTDGLTTDLAAATTDAESAAAIANNTSLSSNEFGTTYHAFIGYQWENVELRAGTQDLPLRLILDKADMFAGTYADQNNVIARSGAGNTTAANSVMLLGGGDTVKFAISLDAGNEDSNNENQSDSIRVGGMVDFAASENVSLALGVESLTDQYNSIGASANIGLADAIDLSVGLNSYSDETDGGDADAFEAVVGIGFGLSETTTLKAQFGQSDIDTNNDAHTYFAVGADFEVADSATFYVLAASGADNGLISTSETDNDGDASVVAAGLRVNF